MENFVFWSLTLWLSTFKDQWEKGLLFPKTQSRFAKVVFDTALGGHPCLLSGAKCNTRVVHLELFHKNSITTNMCFVLNILKIFAVFPNVMAKKKPEFFVLPGVIGQ